ncbi:MAG TPA: T9SS type A sorting domain-containing protein, partial [Bacteroidales bacterium]|nr:T9SS type A sorting domain-containing protein [Bacteroidales bacterium]
GLPYPGGPFIDKLAKEGEEIGIFGNEASGYALVDSVTFGLQNDDISFGRVVDGAQEWKFFDISTPGEPNSATGYSELSAMDDLVIYPNPCYGDLLYLNAIDDISLYDIYGRLILESNDAVRIEVGNLSPGMYIIKTSAGIFRKIVIQ